MNQFFLEGQYFPVISKSLSMHCNEAVWEGGAKNRRYSSLIEVLEPIDEYTNYAAKLH